MLALNSIAAVALLLSYLSPYISPGTNSYIAFFGLAYPPLLVVNLLFLLYWLLFNFKYALVSLAVILLGWSNLLNHFAFNRSRKVTATDSSLVRLMTYNVHNFKRYGAGNDGGTRHDIFEIISLHQPDILGMQEFYSRSRGKYAICDSLQKILNTHHYYFQRVNNNPADAIGMAIFSKLPIVSKGYIQLSTAGSTNQCLYIDVKKNARIFRVYSLHLQSIRFDPADYDYLDSVKNKGETNMQSFRRIGGKLKRAFIKRSEQVAIIKQHMAQCPYPFVISGDFNDTPSSYAVHQLSSGMQNAFRERGQGLGRTYNGDFPNYQIDYIMASPQFKIESYQVVEKKLSDHYPVYSDLRLVR